MHLVEYLCGNINNGSSRSIGNGKAITDTGDILTLIPPILGTDNVTPEAMLKLMDSYNVEKGVLLQGNWLGFQNDYSYKAMKKYPNRFLACCTLDPFTLNKDKILDYFFTTLDFKVLKLELSTGSGIMANHSDVEIDSDLFLSIYSYVNRINGVLVLDIGRPGSASYQVEKVRNIALKYPSLKIVVCHLTAPQINDMTILKENLHILNLPNIYFDLASLPNNTKPEAYPFQVAQSYIRVALDTLGPNKLLWGSDAPSGITRISYSDSINYIKDSSLFTEEEKENIFYNNALNVFFK